MRSTTYRDGYCGTVELNYASPEVCPDGEVRTWIDVVVTEDEFTVGANAVALRLQPDDLRELAAILVEVADAHDGGAA